MSGGPHDILVVDDQPANLAVLTALLTEHGFHVRAVTSGPRALEAAAAKRPDCILLDVNMPGMDGFATCEALQADSRLASVPVLFLTAHDDVAQKARGFEVGGRDYMTKPFQALEVLARVRHHLRLADLERELRTRNEVLEHANAQLQEAAALKARFGAMLVHDLRSPLTVIGMVLEGDAHPEELELAREAHAKLSALVDDMLELARSEQPDVRLPDTIVDLREVIERVGGQARRLAAAAGVRFELALPADRLPLRGDQAHLDRVFANLVDNAIKFTPAGGLVSVACEEQDGDGVEQGMRFAAVRVRDNGPGIPPDELPFIFDAYHQAAAGKRRGGLGLGLAIVARLVALHGGRIRTTSRIGVGTEFCVLLPLSRGTGARAG